MDERNADIEARYKSGCSMSEIGKFYGISAQRVCMILDGRSVDVGLYGPKARTARRRSDLGELIRKTFVFGETIHDIAVRLKVSEDTVLKTMRREKIKHHPFSDGDRRYCSVCGDVDDISNFIVMRYKSYVSYRHKPCANAAFKRWVARKIDEGTDNDDPWIPLSDLIAKFGVRPGSIPRFVKDGRIIRKEDGTGHFLYEAETCRRSIEDGKIRIRAT